MALSRCLKCLVAYMPKDSIILPTEQEADVLPVAKPPLALQRKKTASFSVSHGPHYSLIPVTSLAMYFLNFVLFCVFTMQPSCGGTAGMCHPHLGDSIFTSPN